MLNYLVQLLKISLHDHKIIVNSNYLELWSPRFDSEAPVELEDVGD